MPVFAHRKHRGNRNALGIYGVARVFGPPHREDTRRAATFAQGGEVGFVLYGAALAAGMLDARSSAILSAVVILSMALTPLVVIAVQRFVRPAQPSIDGIDAAADLKGSVLVIGFGRFAQMVCQTLLQRMLDVSIVDNDVDNDVDMIRAACNCGVKVHHGDGTRVDVLRAFGADKVEAVLVCVDKPDPADHLVAVARAKFPYAKLFVRAFDSGHVVRLIPAGVDFQIRETFGSALVFGHAVLSEPGLSRDEADEAVADVRRRVTRRRRRTCVPLAKSRRCGALLHESPGTSLRRSLERVEVDADDAEPLAVAGHSFDVVHHAPVKVAVERHAVGDHVTSPPTLSGAAKLAVHWAVLVRGSVSARYKEATNNEMELMACIVGLREIPAKMLTDKVRKIVVFTDSQYVTDHIAQAHTYWPKSRWCNSDGTPVENVKLWKEFARQIRKAGMRVDFKLVRGRGADQHYEAVEKLARQPASGFLHEPLSV
jgi:voltage-gated potassium channel Kch/ribonuclease HI